MKLLNCYMLLLMLVPFVLACKEKRTKPKVVNRDTVVSEENTFHLVTADSARNDIKAGKVKYYSFGIIGPSEEFISRMKVRYNVELISRGCSPLPDEVAYNKVIDSFLKVKYGITVSSVPEKK